ncbi:hypothetical protein H7169_03675 [Candidatus Gracilibacteria bacterium]|nr:hypothetical protein [Candidatus Gracilibacteria bacterium]
MSIKNQREQLLHAIIGQFTIIVFVLVVAWIYIVPQYDTLSASILSTNIVIEKYTQTSSNGIAYSELDSVLRGSKGKEELLAIIQSAPKETQKVIEKVGGDPYIVWLSTAISASNTDKDKLTLKKARLNSILPTLNPMSNNIIEDTVSMRKYITFVENSILRQFEIESNVALGIQNIKYGRKGSNMPEVIGSFDTEITFTSTNEKITRMIEYINNLGHYEVLMDTGSTSTGGAPAIMSNPLVMIDALSLQTTLDPTKSNEENSGRIVLRFYIRGSSPTDIAFLIEAIKKRKEELRKKIDANIAACKNEVTCSGKKSLEIFERKYSEFSRATSQNKLKSGTEMVYDLSAQLDSINALEKEYRNITGK